MLQDEYQVALDTFHGPLDLLLYLIRRAEVDVQDIPIATITDQYLAFLRQLDDVDIDLAGDFLVMAATLIEIKSRTIMPPEEDEAARAARARGDGPATDPRQELVRQLLAYQRYRIASETLDARRVEYLQRFPGKPGKRGRAEDDGADPIELDLDDVHVLDLSEAYERIMSSIDFTRLGDHKVEIDDTPIELHQEDLLDRLRHTASRRLTLQEAFDGRPAGARIGLFLATLELTRQRRITVKQEAIRGPIEIVLEAEQQHDPSAPQPLSP